jgi:hypothetical protein
LGGTIATRAPKEQSDTSLLSLVTEYCENNSPDAIGWLVTSRRDESLPWILVRPVGDVLPSQGWKLHISANAPVAESVLRQVLPILLKERVSFKVADSLRTLRALNEGEGGYSQIGKFITVYPADDDQAVRLAPALDEATRGLDGPPVPSDRALASGSLVYYRYGAFDERYMQTPIGLILPVITTPDDTADHDQRGVTYWAPEWVTDPFVAAGVADIPPEPRRLIGERYFIVSSLNWSPRNLVYLAMDIVTPRVCVLKRARPATAVGFDGLDAPARLRREAEVLTRLAGDDRFPAVFDLIEQDGDLYLAMEDVEGQRLESYVAGIVMAGRTVPTQQIITWGRELASALNMIHHHGLVYRDLKSGNVIVSAEGRLRLIDFDSAEFLSSQHGSSRGTRGYASPQQAAGDPPCIRDDIYSIGALLFFAATGAEPSIAPNPLSLLSRPLSVLNPALDPELAAVITRCLDPDADRRYPSMEAADAALVAIDIEKSPAPARFGGEPAEPEAAARERERSLARRLGETISRVAQTAPNNRGLVWTTHHPAGAGIHSRDINTGSAGALLALAEMVAAFDDPQHRAVLRRGGEWLTAAKGLEGPPLPGLYVGEAGIGAALLRAGQVLGDDELIAAAARRGRWIASLPYASPDMFNGTAGRLRFHLFLWDATAEPEHLYAAAACGESLLEIALRDHDGVRWEIPPGYADLSGKACLGYAHGAAGIADALLDLFEATEDDRYLASARDAGRWLLPLAVPALDDGSGLDWPDVVGAALNGTFWCRGAVGVGRFFLHAAELRLLPEAAEVAARAARTVARGSRWTSATQCHGLTGSIEFLLDIYQATGDHAYLNEARSLARLLRAFATERDGLLVWPSESPHVYSPDYMVGYAGVAVCLLRLADPERRPHQLSRRGFCYQTARRGRDRGASQAAGCSMSARYSGNG